MGGQVLPKSEAAVGSSSRTDRWRQLLSPHRVGAPAPEERAPERAAPLPDERILPDERTEYDKDYDRIVFSSEFRCLHDKTQVFPLSTSDYTRTRLTHSIEASCVGRSLGQLAGRHLSRAQGVEVDPSHLGTLVAAACLAHDIGNPPFGHSGEAAIQHWVEQRLAPPAPERASPFRGQAEWKDLQSFEGNAQGLRILTRLQSRERWGGLRYTAATLGAMSKYPRPSVLSDGRAPVKLPASVGNLRQGPHYLRAEGPGGERIGQTVTVSGATAEVLVDPVVLAAPPEATATVDAEAQAKLDAYARVMNADFVLVPVLYRAGENTLAVGTALYSTRAKGFNVFPPARFDQSLAGANVEVFKLVDRVSGAMRQFGAVAALPLDVTGRPKAPPAPVVADAREPKLTPPPLVTPAKPQPGVTATAKEPAKGPALWAGVPWYVWVAGGAAAVAVAGGTAYGISQATRPATGTVTATW